MFSSLEVEEQDEVLGDVKSNEEVAQYLKTSKKEPVKSYVTKEVKYPMIEVVLDEESRLDAVRKDIEILRQSTNGFKNFGSLKEKLSTTAQSSGVQDFLDGICDTKKRNIFGWGHGKGYYDREYNAVKKAERLNDLKDFYNSVRYDVKTQQKLKDISRNYRTASEVWANITQAVTLENETGNIKFIEEYMPNSLKTYLKIINNRK